MTTTQKGERGLRGLALIDAGDSVVASVLDNVGASVGDSVVASVLDNVGASVGDSVWNSVMASLRNLTRDDT